MSKVLTFTMDVDDELLARILAAGPVQWGTTGAKPDEEHLGEFADTLAATREYFGTEGDADLHGLFLDGTNLVVAHTGVSPNSPAHARILSGLWNALHATALQASA